MNLYFIAIVATHVAHGVSRDLHHSVHHVIGIVILHSNHMGAVLVHPDDSLCSDEADQGSIPHSEVVH